jgi:hypothetical protein
MTETERRAAFEAAMKQRRWSPEYFRPSILKGHYADEATQAAWNGWNAAILYVAAWIDKNVVDANKQGLAAHVRRLGGEGE